MHARRLQSTSLTFLCLDEHSLLNGLEGLLLGLLFWFAKDELSLEFPLLRKTEGRLGFGGDGRVEVEVLKVGSQAFCFQGSPDCDGKSRSVECACDGGRTHLSAGVLTDKLMDTSGVIGPFSQHAANHLHSSGHLPKFQPRGTVRDNSQDSSPPAHPTQPDPQTTTPSHLLFPAS